MITLWMDNDDEYGVCQFVLTSSGDGGADLVPWVRGPRMLLLGFNLRETFQSQINTEKILYYESR